MSGSAGDGEDSGRRYPRNLQGILNFCTEHTKSEDAPSDAQSHTQMDPEHRQWLEAAIAEMRGTDPVKLILEDIRIITSLTDEAEDNVEKKELALEDLTDHCEQIDLACDFHKLGGYKLLLELLKSSHAGYRWRSAELLATTVQNNPYCQGAALQTGFMPVLLNVIDTDGDAQTRVKALYAVSCLARDMSEGQEVFEAHDGFSVVLRAMMREDEKLQIKAAFMLRAMCDSQGKYKDTLCDIGMVEQLSAILQHPHTTAHEHYVGALLTLCEGHPRSQEECRRPELGLAKILRDKMVALKGKEQFEEEYSHATNLHQLVFGSKSGPVDR